MVPQPEPAAPQTRAEQVLADYRGWLLTERGLRVKVARGYVDSVAPFVTAHAGAEAGLRELVAGDVIAFLTAASRRLAPKTVQRLATAMRSLLRYWHLQGLTGGPLDQVVPKIANRRPGLPQPLEQDQVAALLASCDRQAATGCRDLAMLTLLARMGLRAGEVAALTLDDIDWRNGEITVAGKGSRRDRLPLPADAGEAIAAYLQHGRPAGAVGRSVFVRVRAPAVRPDRGRGHAGGGRGGWTGRAGHDLCAPAAAHRSYRHAAQRRVAGRDRPGAAAPPPAHHRGVCQGDVECAAHAGPAWPGACVDERPGCASRWPDYLRAAPRAGLQARPRREAARPVHQPGWKTAAPPRSPPRGAGLGSRSRHGASRAG